MSAAKRCYIYPTLVRNLHKLQNGQFWVDEFESMPERWQLCTVYLYIEMLSMDLRNMGEISKAELALKLARALVGTETA